MRKSFRERKGYSSDSGVTLVELLVSMLVMAVLLTMVAITLELIFQQTTIQTNRVNSGSNAETSLWTLRVPLRDAVTPYISAISKDGADPTSSSPCWGTLPPAFYPAMPDLPSEPPGPNPVYPEAWAVPAGSALYGSLVSPEDNSLLMAHDFDVVFCAPANLSTSTSPPNIYRLWINPATCADHTVTGGGSCTLEIDNYGVIPSSGAGSCSFPSSPVPSSTSTCTSPPSEPEPLTRTTVATNVWCNLSCQEDIVGKLGSNPLTTTPLFTYYAVPNSPSTTPIPTSDVTLGTGVHAGANLVGIHYVSVSLSALSGRAGAIATASSGVSTSQFWVYMGSTVTQSTTILDSAPVVKSVTPTACTVASGTVACGPIAGGTLGNTGGTVTITGQYFATATAITFGGTQTTFTINSDLSITVVPPPPQSVGLVDVRVTNVNGTSAISTADNYEYVPTVSGASGASGVSPASGVTGTPVTISGTGFASGATVNFGTVRATVTGTSFGSNPQWIKVTAPAGTTTATVHVTVTVANATSPTSSSDLFTNVPAVIGVTAGGVSPASGPHIGGTLVDITGTNFFASGLTVPTVKFGSTTATSVTWVSPTEITATSPAAGAFVTSVDVTVTDPGGTPSATSSADKFTYVL